MAKRFTPKIPRKPLLRRQTYTIPQEYARTYKRKGITSQDEQMMLFHVTQFGGFRIRKIPKDLEIRPNFLDKWFKCESDSGYQSYKANSTFLSQFGGIKLKPLEREWKSEAVNVDEMEEHGYTKAEISDSQKFLSELNYFYSGLRLNIPLPNSGITAEDRIALSRFHGIPFLRKKPKAGGRFFQPESSYQRISSLLRERMTINGQKTSEADLKAAVIQFLDIALRQQNLPGLQDILQGRVDPYQYFLDYLNADQAMNRGEDKPFNREELKKILYTAIYSSGERQEFNVNYKFTVAGRTHKHLDLVSFFPEFFNALSALRTKTQKPLHEVLYKEESQFAQAVLQQGCLEEKLPILPVHDSFITTSGKIERLVQIMNEVSERKYNKALTLHVKY